MDARTARALLSEDRQRLKQLVRTIYDDEPDWLLNFFDGILGQTHFEVVPARDDDALVRGRANEGREGLSGFPSKGQAGDGVADATKPLPGPVFEYITLGLMKRNPYGLINKSLLIETLKEKDIEFVSIQAVTTRLNKMRGEPNFYIVWETGKQNTGLEVTERGHARYGELEGPSTRGLSLQARQWLQERGLWWGPKLPEQARSTVAGG
jgi:hypothetical protein